MRETVKIYTLSVPNNVLRVHNQQHAHAIRSSCPLCKRYGTKAVVLGP